MKTLPIKLLMLFSLFVVIYSCEKDDYTKSEQYKTQNLKEEFTLENFDDVFVKNNLLIKWNDYKVDFDTLSGAEIFEFNTVINVESTNKDYVSYKLLAARNDLNIWEFELIKFSSHKETIHDALSIFNLRNYSGSIHYYDLNGKNTSLKVFKAGKLRSELVIDDKAKYVAPISGGHCSGCHLLVKTDHYKDWFKVGSGNMGISYTHSTYVGSTYEWVWIDGGIGGDYNGMPYDDDTDSYHNHYPHGPNPTNPNSHDEEVILEQIDDSNLNDCHSSLVEVLKTLENGIVGEMIQKLAGTNSTSYNWRLDYNMPEGSNPDATASTDPVATSNSITTHINLNRVNNSTDLSMARTLTHEAIHAFLAYQYRYDYSTNNLNYTTLLDNYADEFNSNANDTHHILFLKENLIDPISSTLQEYGENLGYNLPNQYYRDMAYGGLYNTSATNNVFENLVPNQSDRDRIKNRISAETDNRNVNGLTPKGEKACN